MAECPKPTQGCNWKLPGTPPAHAGRAKLVGTLSCALNSALIYLVQELPLEFFIAAHDGQSMQRAVERLAGHLKAPLLVRVVGNLGAGKTTLVAALLTYWQCPGANSPTFNLRNDYASAGGRVIHLDLYRLKSTDDALDLLPPDEDYSDAIVFVEWPDRAPAHLFAPFAKQTELRLEVSSDESRHVTWRLL